MAALGLRRRIKLGPALRIAPLPAAGLTLSILAHSALIIAIVVAVSTLQETEQVYTVSLAPALGSPQSETPAPPSPVPSPPAPASRTPDPVAPRPREPQARPTPLPPRELPSREPSRELPAREMPERAIPDRTLSERTAPSAPTPLPPRADQKELPTVASSKPVTPLPQLTTQPAPRVTQSTPTPPSPATTTPSTAAPAGPGLPTGSQEGFGKVAVEGTFPYPLYLAAVERKISEKWEGRANPGNQPLVKFEIERDGRVNPNRIKVEKSSGNPQYDRIAVRAIADALPFPPLPEGFKPSQLPLQIQFWFRQGG